MANFTLKISKDDLDETLPEIMAQALNEFGQGAAKIILANIRSLIEEAFYSNETLNALSGELGAEFGLEHSWISPAQYGIIEGIKAETAVIFNRFRVYSKNISGGFSVRFLNKNYSQILQAPYVSYVSDRSKTTISWLEWLLKAGAAPIVLNWRVSFGDYPSSRSGLAIMKPSISSSWSVPAEYSGTAGDNFITKEINSPIFQAAVAKRVEKVFEDFRQI